MGDHIRGAELSIVGPGAVRLPNSVNRGNFPAGSPVPQTGIVGVNDPAVTETPLTQGWRAPRGTKMSARKLDVAFFSSGASLVFPGQEPKAFVHKPDVAAPGVDVLSSIPPEQTADGTREYAYFDGTSMASPHVAGVMALLMAAEPDAPIADIVQALKETANHPDGDDARPDNRWGYGMIRPVEALGALRS